MPNTTRESSRFLLILATTATKRLGSAFTTQSLSLFNRGPLFVLTTALHAARRTLQNQPAKPPQQQRSPAGSSKASSHDSRRDPLIYCSDQHSRDSCPITGPGGSARTLHSQGQGLGDERAYPDSCPDSRHSAVLQPRNSSFLYSERLPFAGFDSKTDHFPVDRLAILVA